MCAAYETPRKCLWVRAENVYEHCLLHWEILDKYHSQKPISQNGTNTISTFCTIYVDEQFDIASHFDKQMGQIICGMIIQWHDLMGPLFKSN